MATGRTIRQSLLTVRAKNGDTLTVVTFAEGGIGITRNDNQIDDFYWSDSDRDLGACTTTIMGLAGIERMQ